MRIGDAVNFSVERLKGTRVFFYTQKTGVAVNTILPDFVVDALAATPKVTDKFYSWSGIGTEPSFSPGRGDWTSGPGMAADVADSWCRSELTSLASA